MQNQLYYILDIHAFQTSIRIKQGLSRRLQLYTLYVQLNGNAVSLHI